jgi:hypothetical protein
LLPQKAEQWCHRSVLRCGEGIHELREHFGSRWSAHWREHEEWNYRTALRVYERILADCRFAAEDGGGRAGEA